ncbi:nucleoporin NUP42-like [Limanda limanda]|uniref:nucleoporin NUP42-like n=1 Tax=Limanda limanda TaxID=27771 RepID=UPI0029C8E246|nr:nucleoporin NUP42-like [Limanda limanda]
MPICKYFLQGRCRYGHNCLNEHPKGGEGGGGEVIKMDMEIWENSHQWWLSCYSNSKAPLSGFTDFSQEELRWEYYSRRALGDLQSYATKKVKTVLQ